MTTPICRGTAVWALVMAGAAACSSSLPSTTSDVGGRGGTSTGGTGGVGGTFANPCLPASPVYPDLAFRTFGGPLPGAYDGRATVERGVDGELILGFAATSTGAAGAGAADQRHFGITGTVPRFPLGAQVWLTKSPDPDGFIFAPQPPAAFSVRDVEGGTLLLGASQRGTPTGSPLALGGITTICSVPATMDFCAPPGSSVDYLSVTAQADAPVTVRNGEPAVVSLQGRPYDVRLSAWDTRLSAASSQTCADYFPPGDLWADVRAQSLATLAGALAVGSPPACRQGNDPDRVVYFHVPNAGTFEGTVTYRGPDPRFPGTYRFVVDGLGTPAELEISGASAVMDEPPVNQPFWLSYDSSGVSALFERHDGPLVLAAYHGAGRAGELSSLTSALGAPATLEAGCDYAPNITLWRLVIDGNARVAIGSGEIGALSVDGRNLQVWTRSGPDVAITVYRAR